MRFNHKAVALIAELPSSSFDLEGVLGIYEKTDGLFKKQSGYVKHFVRIYGNLLFMFKGINHKSGVHCLYIMERYSLNICSEVEFSFIIEFQDGETVLKICTDSESSLKKWVTTLTSASSERMNIHLTALKERCSQLEDNFTLPDGISMISDNTLCTNSTLELIISCRELNVCFPTTNSMVEVYISNKTAGNPDLDTFWNLHHQTEIVEDCLNPFYQVKIIFKQSDNISSATHLKFICKDIREQMSMTAIEIGSCILSIGSILLEESFTIKKPLMGAKMESCGEIVITADYIDDLMTEEKLSSNDQKRISRMSSKSKSRLCSLFYKPPDCIYPHLAANIYTCEFRFRRHARRISEDSDRADPATNADQCGHVDLTEHLAGTRLSFRLAEQILKIYIVEEKEVINNLVENADRLRCFELGNDLLKYYGDCLNMISDSKDFYKQSIDKENILMSHVPTNFHLHRTVITQENSPDDLFDIFTVGAFTAFSMGYKSGGINTHMLPTENLFTVYNMKKRKNICFCQGLVSLVIAMYTSLLTHHQEENWCRIIDQIGPMFYFESLLSCHGQEKGMLEDMRFVSAILHENLTFSLSSNAVFPIITQNGKKFSVQIPLPFDVLNSYSPELRSGRPFRIHTCFFTVGINEIATLAEKINSTEIQENINYTASSNIYEYMQKFMSLSILDTNEMKSLEEIYRKLDMNVNNKIGKNVQILHLASELSRKMSAVRFTSCKSAKDRTAMSITLEQAKILKNSHFVETDIQRLLDSLRSQGVRRENTRRNTGHRRYAFNTLQLSMFPKLYRPPKGTYSSIQS